MTPLSLLLALAALALSFFNFTLWARVARRGEELPAAGVVLGYLSAALTLSSIATLLPEHGDLFRLGVIGGSLLLTGGWRWLLWRETARLPTRNHFAPPAEALC